MRKVYDSQYDLWQAQIADIKFDPKDRDDIPAVLMGLQALHGDAKVRTKVFEILRRHVRSEVSHRHGRPGMDLWRIFVALHFYEWGACFWRPSGYRSSPPR